VVFYAVLNDYFDAIEINDIKKIEEEFIDYLDKLHDEDILRPIRKKGELTDGIENKLKEATGRFVKNLEIKK